MDEDCSSTQPPSREGFLNTRANGRIDTLAGLLAYPGLSDVFPWRPLRRIPQ
jgi:hypothetical protein